MDNWLKRIMGKIRKDKPSTVILQAVDEEKETEDSSMIEDLSNYEFRLPEVGELLSLEPRKGTGESLTARIIKVNGIDESYALIDENKHTAVRIKTDYFTYDNFGSIHKLMEMALRKYRMKSLSDRSVIVVKERDKRI